MGRVMNGFCDGCDCLDSNSWGLFCQILGGGCIREGHPDNVKEGNTLSEDNKGLENKDEHTLDYDEITRILEEALRNEDIEAFYARTSNKLKIVAECYDGDDDGEYDFLNELISHLKGIIVHKFMKEHGWIQDVQDEFKRWKREE